MLGSGGIFLNVDACSKFIRKKSVLEEYYERLNRGERPEFIAEEYNSSNGNFPRKSVLARHNSCTYQVDGLVLDLNPISCRFSYEDGTQQTVFEHFR